MCPSATILFTAVLLLHNYCTSNNPNIHHKEWTKKCSDELASFNYARYTASYLLQHLKKCKLTSSFLGNESDYASTCNFMVFGNEGCFTIYSLLRVMM